MTQEEKAKRYDEIIKKTNKMHSENCETCQICIEELIPELKESEDEMIRKALIDVFTVMKESKNCGKTFSNHDIPVVDILAWLEKQGEQSDANKEYWRGYNEGKQCILDKYAELEKQGEQNPADKVEPKFKVGDKIVEDNEFGMVGGEITDVDATHYELDYGGKYIPISSQDNFKLIEQKPAEWTQDNVEELTEFENVMMHIGNSFFGDNAGLDPNDTNAIKEQANTLLGLVPRQEWSKEEKESLELLVNYISSLADVMPYNIIIPPYNNRKRMLNFLKSLRFQSHWKPSDEQLNHYKK